MGSGSAKYKNVQQELESVRVGFPISATQDFEYLTVSDPK